MSKKIKKHNVLVVTYWSFKDALVQTYTLPYVKMIQKNLPKGSKIFLTTFEQDKYATNKKEWRDIKKRYKEELNIHLIKVRYSHFGIKAIIKIIAYLFYLYFTVIFQNIKTIHSWCTPAGAIAYYLSKLTFKKLVLDSFEPHAEVMLEGKTWTKNSLAFKTLFSLERKMLKRASTVIFTTKSMKDYSENKYGVKKNDYYFKPACINFEKFNNNETPNQETLKKELELTNKIVMVYAGKLGGLYHEKEVFDIVNIAINKWEDNFRFLFLTSTSKQEINKWIHQLNIPQKFIIDKFVSHADVPQYMSLADFALNPMKSIPSRRHSAPIKDGEYWAMGLPVIITKNISDDSDIIEQNNIGYVLNDLNENEYTKALAKIETLIRKQDVKDKIVAIAKKYRSFDIAEEIYKKIYSNN